MNTRPCPGRGGPGLAKLALTNGASRRLARLTRMDDKEHTLTTEEMDVTAGDTSMTSLVSEPRNLQLPDWQNDFETAARQAVQTPGRIQAMKAAVLSRLKAKLENPPGPLERIALNDAILLLRTLRSGSPPNATLETDLE